MADENSIVANSILFEGLTSDPTTPSDGSMWYRSDLKKFYKRVDGATVELGGAKSINFGPNGLVASAGGSWVFVGDELVWQTNDGNTVATYFTFVVPADYVSGAELQFWTRRDNVITATVDSWIDNVIDSTIATASINPTANLTWELFTLIYGDTVAAGDVINVQIDSDTSTNPGVRLFQLKSATFNYSI